MKHLAFIVAVAATLAATQSEAQSLRLRQAGTGASRVEVAVGDIIEIEIVVDVQEVPAAGIAVFLTIEGDGFAVVDNGQVGEVGTQPFLRGPLFDTTPVRNVLLSDKQDPIAQTIPGLQLDYAVLLQEGGVPPAGPGVVASIQLLAIGPTEGGRVVIDDNPIRETRLVGVDRVSERRFRAVAGMEITVVNPATAVDAATWGELKRGGT